MSGVLTTVGNPAFHRQLLSGHWKMPNDVIFKQVVFWFLKGGEGRDKFLSCYDKFNETWNTLYSMLFTFVFFRIDLKM